MKDNDNAQWISGSYVIIIISIIDSCGGLTLIGCKMPTKQFYHSPSQQDSGARKEDGKTLLDQDKGSLIKLKERPCLEAKENRTFILYFSSAGNVQPLPGK